MSEDGAAPLSFARSKVATYTVLGSLGFEIVGAIKGGDHLPQRTAHAERSRFGAGANTSKRRAEPRAAGNRVHARARRGDPDLGNDGARQKIADHSAAIERAKNGGQHATRSRSARAGRRPTRCVTSRSLRPKTAHAQGSAFVRGLTGQQTLLMFDGIRLNNSTYRQGPNQYFFTLDAQTIDSIVVRRGGASARYGSDAIGGVIAAQPLRAPAVAAGQRRIAPSVTLSGATADESVGGRLQLAWSQGRQLRVLAGVGGRRVGELEGSGVLLSPETGEPAQVPMMRPDGRTQAGTGFDELTFDGSVPRAGTPKTDSA